jgi:hypothetical protein
MLILTNVKLANMIYGCERLIKSGTERLDKRKLLKVGLEEINQGVGGLKTIQDILKQSYEVKSISIGEWEAK